MSEIEVSQSTVESLEHIAEEEGVDVEEVQEEFKENYQNVQSNSTDYSDEKAEELALRFTRTSTFSNSRIPSDEIEMLTIGGDVRDTSNGEMFFGTAVVDEGGDSNEVLGQIRIFDDSLANEVYDAFSQVGNIVTGNFAVSESGFRNHVEVRDADDTSFEVSRPDNREELVDEIREYIPETSIATIADDVVATTRTDDGDEYAVSSDLRRIEADIYDGYKNPDTGTGIYTLRDNTVFDEEDIADSPVFDGENANENATPGLTCFVDPNRMEYGSGSVVEFFGTVNTSDDGTIQFSADGVVPIFENEEGFDGYTDSEESEEPTREQESTNVDRTQI